MMNPFRILSENPLGKEPLERVGKLVLGLIFGAKIVLIKRGWSWVHCL
jgi:hypothetical protein